MHRYLTWIMNQTTRTLLYSTLGAIIIGGVTYAAGSSLIGGRITFDVGTNAPEVCIAGVCRTTWPTTGAGAGGTVTGPITWSAEYGAMTYANAWSTCLSLAPTGQWRIPIFSDIEIGRYLNAGLFTGNKFYWSSSPVDGSYGFWAWYPAGSYWVGCNAGSTGCNDGFGYGFPMALRCVSNS